MSEERKKILSMLADGKINVEEAERLLGAIEDGADSKSDSTENFNSKRSPEFLHVKANDHGGDKVNIRVPIKLLKAGIRLTALVPGMAGEKIQEKLKDKGIDLNLKNLNEKELQDALDALQELSVEVGDESGDNVRIYCE